MMTRIKQIAQDRDKKILEQRETPQIAAPIPAPTPDAAE
jgi:hypothetical protein